VGELVLTKEQERPRMQERRGRDLHGDKSDDVGEEGVKPAKAGEDQRLIRHRLTDIAKRVRERLKPVAVGGDGEVSLDDGTEFRLEVDDTSELVVEEEVVDERVGLVCGAMMMSRMSSRWSRRATNGRRSRGETTRRCGRRPGC
jgi:hypothetical protein